MMPLPCRFFPIHMLIVGAAIMYQLHLKIEKVPTGEGIFKGLPCVDGPGVLNLAVIQGLLAYGLMSSDHIACGSEWALPQMHALGQIVGAAALYSALVLGAYLRLQQKRVPSEVDYYIGGIPFVRRLQKDRKN